MLIERIKEEQWDQKSDEEFRKVFNVFCKGAHVVHKRHMVEVYNSFVKAHHHNKRKDLLDVLSTCDVAVQLLSFRKKKVGANVERSAEVFVKTMTNTRSSPSTVVFVFLSFFLKKEKKMTV